MDGTTGIDTDSLRTASGRPYWGFEPGSRLRVFFLGPQKDGLANSEATNGKPPRDLGFQDTGKQGIRVGLRMGWEGRGPSTKTWRISSVLHSVP